MNNLRLPYFWSGLSYVQKAAHLCATHQARSFNEACSILAKCRARKKRPTPQQYQADLDKRKLS